MIRVVVVALTLAVRVGLHALIDDVEGVEVITEAATLAELDSLPQEFDVLVIVTEEALSLELDRVLGENETVAVLALVAGGTNPGQILFRSSPRAWGVLALDTSAEELLAAITALHEGLIVGTPTLMKPMFFPQLDSEGISSLDTQMKRLIEPLTERETQVLQLLAQGLANKQIALSLRISEHTVKFHISAIYAKLGATNRTEAVRLGVRQGLVVL